MQYIIFGLGFVVLLMIKSFYDERENKKKLVKMLHKEWGAVPEEEYTDEKFKSLKSYHNAHKDKNIDIDDITWNDIDMDQIFMLMNNTGSAIGEEYLYHLLRNLQFDHEVLEERNALIEFFQNNPKKRIEIQVPLSRMGKLPNISIYEYINRTEDIKRESNWMHIFSIVGLIASIGMLLFNIATGFLLLFGFVAFNLITYYRRKVVIEKYFSVFSYILRLLNSIQGISSLDIPEISRYTKELKKVSGSFRKFKTGAKLVVSAGSGSIADIILDYFKMLFHIDLIKFNSMLSEFNKNQEQLNSIYKIVGLLDSMIGVASFRLLMNNEYVLPVLENNKKPFINIDSVYHPVIDEPVPNSISEDKCILITGSNASGKSTFIKTVAINAILSQTIFTSLSKSYHASFFKVFSSMALRDDILSQESYYIVEIKSLKRILDRIDDKIPTLCFVDEVLRGTNTLERIAASSQILNSFAQNNALCFAATHDIELTHILDKIYSNYHFQEQIQDNNIIFDYMLYTGRAMSRNAIKLLGMIGYDDSIIDKATKEANYFMEHGVWNELKLGKDIE
jgi:DNA mismatch repair ATPase MutS